MSALAAGVAVNQVEPDIAVNAALRPSLPGGAAESSAPDELLLSDPAYAASLQGDQSTDDATSPARRGARSTNDEVLGITRDADGPAPSVDLTPVAPAPTEPPALVTATPVPTPTAVSAPPPTAAPTPVPPTPVPPSPVRPTAVPPTAVPPPPTLAPVPTPLPAPPATLVPVRPAPLPTLAPTFVPVPSGPRLTRSGPAGVVNQIPASAWRWLTNYGWTVEWRQGPGPGRISEAQYATSTIVIWYETRRSDTLWAGAFAHELGHAVSYVHFGSHQMNEWNAMRGLSSWRWVPGTPNDFSVGEGDFAEAFMSYLLGHNVRSVGGPLTQQHITWISNNTPF